MIIRLFDYSVGMTLFDSLTHYLNNRYHFVYYIQMERPALKLNIVNVVMYLCCKNSILEKTLLEIVLRL